MRLTQHRINSIVTELTEHLIKNELVEVDATQRGEFDLDVESVLKEWVRADRALAEEAKDMAHEQGLDYSAHQKIKRRLADRREFGINDDAIGYLCNQLIETLLHTRNVEEIYGEDRQLRAAISPILKKHMSNEDPLDEEVRKRIKNLQEGTQDWDIQYQNVMERLRRLRGEA